MSYRYSYKIIVLGDQSVGKTALVNRLNNHIFTDLYQSTIGVDFTTYHMNTIDNTPIKCQLWDTAGQESYDSIIKNYYRNIAAAVMVFDVNNTESFHNLSNWITKLNDNNNYNNGKIPTIIVGNKIDIGKRTITKEQASNYAYKNDFLYIETSAKTSDNIPDFLHLICEKIYENMIYNNCEFGIKENPYIEPEQNNIDDLFCDVKKLIRQHNCCNII